ncbi:type II secretion system protein E [Escherichia coli]|nr:type II secretion system protein E [Escherichia coli]
MTIYQSMSDLSDNMFKAYMPQDARLKQEFLQDVGLFGARYAHINTPKGVFAVMRLIPDDGSAPPSLETLGFSAGTDCGHPRHARQSGCHHHQLRSHRFR